MDTMTVHSARKGWRTMRGRLRMAGCGGGSMPLESQGMRNVEEPLRSDAGISPLPVPLAMEPSNTVLLWLALPPAELHSRANQRWI